MHGAKSSAEIYRKLEVALDKLKDTRSALMETDNGMDADNNETMLGTEERFEFDVDVDAEVTHKIPAQRRRQYEPCETRQRGV